MADRAQAPASLILTVVMVLVLFGALTDVAAQGDTTSASTTADVLFTSPGVDASVLARSSANVNDVSEPRFLLERIAIDDERSLIERTTASPELVYVESGSATYQDDFGFTVSANTGESLSFAAGATYALNVSSETSLYRLSFAPGTTAAPTTDVDVDFTAATPVAATPVAATPVAAAPITVSPVIKPSVDHPVALNVPTELLMDQAIPNVPTDTTAIFIARAVFEPGAESGEQQHSGPLGLHVEDGTLNVVTPSGAEGQLQAGSSAILPTEAPLIARNAGSDLVSVLIVGIVADADNLFVTSTPAPIATATMEATGTPEPTATEVAMEPTEVAASTSFDDWGASASWVVQDDMLLYVGEERDYSTIEVPISFDSTSGYAMEFEARFMSTSVRCGRFGAFVANDMFGSINVGLNWLGHNCDKRVINGTRVTSGPRMTVAVWSPSGVPMEVDRGCSDYVGDCPMYLAHQAFDPGAEWHTYRIEVQGQEMRVFMDGTMVLQASHPDLAVGGTMGLWSQGAQFAIRNFSVTQLPAA